MQNWRINDDSLNIYINDGFSSKPCCWSRDGTQLWDQQRGPKSRVGMFSKKNVLQLSRSRNQWKINPAISQLIAVSLSCSSIFKADDAHPFKDHCETPADKLGLQTQRARVIDGFSHEHHHLSSLIWGNNSHTPETSASFGHYYPNLPLLTIIPVKTERPQAWVPLARLKTCPATPAPTAEKTDRTSGNASGRWPRYWTWFFGGA